MGTMAPLGAFSNVPTSRAIDPWTTGLVARAICFQIGVLCDERTLFNSTTSWEPWPRLGPSQTCRLPAPSTPGLPAWSPGLSAFRSESSVTRGLSSIQLPHGNHGPAWGLLKRADFPRHRPLDYRPGRQGYLLSDRSPL